MTVLREHLVLIWISMMNLSRPSFSTSIKHVIGNPLLRVSYFNLKSGPPSTAVYIDNFESLCVSIEFN